ncbi:MAG: MBL fold metallo-hydrolase [Synergistaceae bacterium]|nr:MBL fold metallo-hydrolase [Synergistaceae bacterium]MBR0169072.1 MBL fold metallo-hydrolase [Synergistaceae bacterium]
MYELVNVRGKSFYIESPAKIGLVKLDGDKVCLIDSGSDKEAGRKIRKILDSEGLKLTAIFNTHSNADHIGGNKYLQSQTGCKIYAPDIECAFTRYPILEASFLYGGYPMKELRHKFLMAQESNAEYLTPEVLPDGWEIIPLPGHFFSMAGFRTPDDVVYLADCLSSVETLKKYRISFIYDVGAYISTLETVKSMEAEAFVPSHAPVTDEISGLAQYNIDSVNEIADIIAGICREPLNFESVLQRLFSVLNLSMTFEQYVLAGSTVRSYLSWLKDKGRVKAYFSDNMLLWEAE